MKMFKGAKKAAALVLAAVMVIGGSCMTVMAAGDTHVLEADKLTAGGEGTWGDGAKVDVDGYFTLHMSAKTKIDSSSKTWDDGYTSEQRINFGAGITVEGEAMDCISFTTKGAATVKIWWVEADESTREMVILKADGTEVAKSTEGAGTEKNKVAFSTLKISEAGTYYLGGSPKKNYIFKVEVVESAAAADAVPKTGVVSATVIMGAAAIAGTGMAVVTRKKKED